MTEINRQPSGLSDLLLVRAGGRNPDQLSETVRPTVDIEPFYWPDRMRGALKPFNLAQGQIEFIDVPDGEVWRVLTAQVNCTITAGSYANMQLGVERLPGRGLNPTYLGAFHFQDDLGAAQNRCDALQFPFPLILTEGQRFTVDMWGENVLGAVVGQLELVYVLLQS